MRFGGHKLLYNVAGSCKKQKLFIRLKGCKWFKAQFFDKNWTIPSLFFFSFWSFQCVWQNICRWLDSNRGSLVAEATADLRTEPQLEGVEPLYPRKKSMIQLISFNILEHIWYLMASVENKPSLCKVIIDILYFQTQQKRQFANCEKVDVLEINVELNN